MRVGGHFRSSSVMEGRSGRAAGPQQMTPSLLHICMSQAAKHLLDLAEDLHKLPFELGELLLKYHLGRGDNPRLLELEIMAEAFWNPKQVCLSGVCGLNSSGLHHLSYARNLLDLDLSGCSWLDSLSFLSELVELRRLCLRDCWRLAGDALTYVQQLRKLVCLDVGNVYSITDNLAARFIQGMKSLQALNMSGTGVGDGFVEALTYGCRLQAWGASRGTHSAIGWPVSVLATSQEHKRSMRDTQIDSYDILLQQWPPLQIKYLWLQCTVVTQAAISQLLALKDIMLLDVRTLNIKRSSLVPFQAKFGLAALPNESRLLARSSSLLVATLRLGCGCLSIDETGEITVQQLKGEKLVGVAEFERRGFMQLLREASRVRSRGIN